MRSHKQVQVAVPVHIERSGRREAGRNDQTHLNAASFVTLRLDETGHAAPSTLPALSTLSTLSALSALSTLSTLSALSALSALSTLSALSALSTLFRCAVIEQEGEMADGVPD